MKPLIRSIALGLVLIGWFHSPLLAQSGSGPSATTRPRLSSIQRKVDSLQQLTQPGYYPALFAKAKRQAQAARRLAGNICYGYLCGMVNGEIISVKFGEWNDPTVWSASRIPTSSDVVRLYHAILLPTSYRATAKQVRYSAGGKLLPATASNLRLGQ